MKTEAANPTFSVISPASSCIPNVWEFFCVPLSRTGSDVKCGHCENRMFRDKGTYQDQIFSLKNFRILWQLCWVQSCASGLSKRD